MMKTVCLKPLWQPGVPKKSPTWSDKGEFTHSSRIGWFKEKSTMFFCHEVVSNMHRYVYIYIYPITPPIFQQSHLTGTSASKCKSTLQPGNPNSAWACSMIITMLSSNATTFSSKNCTHARRSEPTKRYCLGNRMKRSEKSQKQWYWAGLLFW